MTWGTNMADDMEKFDDLDALFDTARKQAPHPTSALRDRVLHDAGVIQSGFAGPVAAPPAVASGGWFRQVSDALGGWAGLGGLATACAAGVWLGFAPPSALPDPASYLIQDQSSFDLFQGEDLALLFDSEEG